MHDVASAIDSSGVCNDYTIRTMIVYIHLFSADGQFFGSEESRHGQLRSPFGICVDSTNTVYVTDENHIVFQCTLALLWKVHQVLRYMREWSGGAELDGPKGLAVDNTTGALYV